MEADTSSTPRNGTLEDGKLWQTYPKSFSQVQSILGQNRILINEISQNHESKIPANITRNVALIRHLSNNITRIVDLYANLSKDFAKALEGSSEGESTGASEEESTRTLDGDTIVTKPQTISGRQRIRSS